MNDSVTTLHAGALPFSAPEPRTSERPPEWNVTAGDALRVLRTLKPASVEAVITDPPYGIGFMGRRWDTFEPDDGAPSGPAAFQEWTRRWASAALLASKPGANWLVAAAPRTAHRVACGLEDAGLRIVTTVIWLYGQGFAKGRRLATGIHTELKPAWEPIILARAPSADTATATYARYRTGGLDIDACLLDTPAGNGHWSGDDGSDRTSRPGYEGGFTTGGTRRDGRWPPNVAMDAETACALDEQAGKRRSGGFPARRGAPKFNLVYDRLDGQDDVPAGRGRTTGGASRFFYCPKASRSERDFGLRPDSKATGSETGELINDHEAVKPVELMRWLVRLAAPRDGVVLDPFAGSGSTGVACLLEGRSFRGIEQDAKYAAIARARIHAASSVEPRPPRPTCPTRKEPGSSRCRATTHPTDPS